MSFKSSISNSSDGTDQCPILSPLWITLDKSERCPHEGDYSLSRYLVSIQICQEHSVTCSECRILLQTVEVFKPGWIYRHKTDNNLLAVHGGSIDGAYTVHLALRRELKTRGDWHRDLYAPAELEASARETASFQIFRRSQAEPFYQNGEDWSRDLPRMLRNPRSQSLKIVGESFSQAAFGRAAKWLSYCLENDQACDLSETEFMPRHLIDIGSWDGSREPFLFKPSQPAPYACLSYCWGSDTDGILTTTTSNIGSHYEAIPVSEMPCGIKDAITVCRGLKIRNLWVDSLCIAQDDPVAWLHDAREMDRIYLHSLLTIAALEPASCKSPFLGRQRYGQPEWQHRLVTDVSATKDGAPLEVFVRSTARELDDLHDQCSLDKRGWCLQESLLPNRRLIFSGNEMIWECLCRKICECGHILWRPQPFHFAKSGVSLKQTLLRAEVMLSNPLPAVYHNNGVSTKYLRTPPNGLGEGYPSEAHRRWREIVVEFSKRSLSRQKDKLNAVSGLANMVRKNIQHGAQDHSNSSKLPQEDEYVAGLWKRELHFDLAWEVAHLRPGKAVEGIADTVHTKDKPRRGAGHDEAFPSWSWASVDEAITYEFDSALEAWGYSPCLRDCIKVEDVSYHRDVRNGEIAMDGDGRAVLTGGIINVGLNIERHQHHEPKVRVRRLDNGYVGGLTLDRAGSVRQDDDLCCFRLFSWEALTGYEDHDGKRVDMGPQSWFLLLRRLGVAEELFERVGLGSDEPVGRYVGAEGLFTNCSIATVSIV